MMVLSWGSLLGGDVGCRWLDAGGLLLSHGAVLVVIGIS